MITCLDMNITALGNALFQFSTLFGVGKKLGFDIRVPVGNNHIHRPTGQNIIQLKEVFDITIPDISKEETDLISHTYLEKERSFNEEIFHIEDYTNLKGYYQYFEYFQEYEKELRAELKFKDKWIQESDNLFNKLGVDRNKCIGIHRRLGDYMSPHLKYFHPILSMDYYTEACRYLKQNGDKNDCKYLIFSDSIDIVKREFADHCIFIDNREYEEYAGIMDFVTMSQCTGGKILANSSYSIWAAWLGEKCPTIYSNIYTGPGYNWWNPINNKEWIRI